MSQIGYDEVLIRFRILDPPCGIVPVSRICSLERLFYAERQTRWRVRLDVTQLVGLNVCTTSISSSKSPAGSLSD
jgi:hypothetical protein